MIKLNTVEYGTKDYSVKVVNGVNYGEEYPFSYETLAVIQRATTEGYTLPDFKTKVAIDLLIKSMKSAGVWTKLDVYYEFSYNNTGLQNFSKINWRKPSGSLLVTGGTPLFTVNGWEGNGSNGFLDTMFNPTTAGQIYSQNNASRGTVVYKLGGAGSISTIDSSGDTSAGELLRNLSDTTKRINQGNGNTAANIDFTGTGFTLMCRDNSTAVRGIKKAVETSTTATSAANTNFNIHLLRRATTFSTLGISNYFLGSTITFAESQLMRTGYNSYLQKLNLAQIA